MTHRSTGMHGERLAKNYLVSQGYSVVATNWHTRTGEIDLIAHDDHTGELVFVEVKTRQSAAFGWPEEKVTPEKRHKIAKTAHLFLFDNQYPEQQPWRIDVISIITSSSDSSVDITHFKNIEI